MQALKENKVFRFLYRLMKTLIYLLLICIIFIIVIQKVSGNTITIGGIRIFNVISGSMEPDYEKGDLLIVKETDVNKLKVGNDIVYNGEQGQVAGMVVTHRIIEINETENGRVFKTKGLTNMVEDPEVKEHQILGKVVYKMFILSVINKLMYNIYVFYFILIIPTGVIVFLEIKDIRERLREEDDV